MRRILLTYILSLLLCAPLLSQSSSGGYTYVKEIDPRLQRNLMANELMLDDQGKYLVANFGNSPSYIVVFDTENWEPVFNFRLPDWVDFSGAYIDMETHDLYLLESRYSSKYYKLNLITGSKILMECTETPNGCVVVEPKKPVKSIHTPDKKYFIKIKHRTQRAIYLYQSK